MRSFALIFLGICFVCAPSLAAGTLNLAVRGLGPEYAIVRPADASPSEVYAAEEMRDFTERMTGVRLPIVIVGEVAEAPLPQKAVFLNSSRISSRVACPADLGEDGFRLKAEGQDLFVAGGKRGVLYGVYELLERYGGCRWYASWHTVVPKRDSFSVPDNLDDTQIPAFAHREPFWLDMFNDDFAARNRANGPSMRLEAKHGGCAGRFGRNLGNCHTFNFLLPPEKHFAEHPEYYSMVNGKRIKEKTQLCLTNTNVLRLVTAKVLDCIRKDPSADYYGVSQNDWMNYCECPQCAAVDDEEGSPAGTMIRFVNAIAEAVEKEYPDKIIETLAYQYTRKPPRKTRPRHNVMPCLCSIECDFSRPITSSGYQENVAFAEDIKAWHEISSRLYVWNYGTDFHFFPHPFPNVYSMQGNMKLFRANGVHAVFEQGCRHGPNAGFAELKAWLAAKWMWNPNAPMGALLDDFFSGFYGAGAQYMMQYFKKLHRRQISYTSADPSRWLNIHQDVPGPDIPLEFWDEADKLIACALAAVKGDVVRESNVLAARFGVDCVRLEYLRHGSVVDLSGLVASRLPEMQQIAKRVVAYYEKVGNIRINSIKQRDDMIIKAWRWIANCEAPARRDGVAEDSFFMLLRPGEGSEFVYDCAAEDGRALKLANNRPCWSVNFDMHNASFEGKRRCTLMARLRSDPVPGGRGTAVAVGIFDPVTDRKLCGTDIPAEAISESYKWYAIGSFNSDDLTVPSYLYVGDGYCDDGGRRSVEAVYLDKIRFE